MSHIERMEVEHAELKQKIDGLTAFTTTQVFLDLPSIDQQLMEEQCKHMVDYLVILGRRLERSKEA